MLKKFLKDLNDNTKIALTSVFILFVTFIVCLNIVKHQVSRKEDISLEVLQQSKRMVLRKDINKLEAKYGEYVERFYESIDADNFRLAISDIARKSNVDIVLMRPFGRKEFVNASKDLLEISLKCTYSQLVEFIASIEKLPKLTRVENLSVAALSDAGYFGIQQEAERESASSDTRITVSLIVCAYSIKR